MEVCRTGLNNAESLLNKKENNLIELQEQLNQVKISNTSLTEKYDELLTQFNIDKEHYQLQNSQLNEKVTFIVIYNFYYFTILFLCLIISILM